MTRPHRDREGGVMTIIIRPAVQKQIDDAKRREDFDRMEFTHEHWHSDEAKRAWRDRQPETRGGILLPLKYSDWFALGYDAALKATHPTTSSPSEMEQRA